jgi:hypothetical protein
MDRKKIYRNLFSREGTLSREIQERVLEKFGDGTPFRWRDVNKIAVKALKDVRNIDGVGGQYATDNFLTRNIWVVRHPALGEERFGRYFSIVDPESLQRCLEHGARETSRGSPRWLDPDYYCLACHRKHPRPFRPDPL